MPAEPYTARLAPALPFAVSFLLVPLLIWAARQGGWALVLPPLMAWGGFTALDLLVGLDRDNADPDTPDERLKWHRAVTLVWLPLQIALLFGLLTYCHQTAHLNPAEKLALFFGMGVASGTIGINFSHELMHRQSRLERWMADILLASVMYSHFRTEHLLVHHVWVGTPKDAVTAKYAEGFPRFFARVLRQSFLSAWRTEKARLARRGKPVWSAANPFWRYWGLQAIFIGLALAVGGWAGLGLFLFQAFVAIWQLELVNYVEHYGLTREYLGDGRYEPAGPHHSWNAAHWASNRLLINLQRHSDHHLRPGRRYPLLQDYPDDIAPSLPHGYPAMTLLAMWPRAWRARMNPRVRAWRKRHYPAITDWAAYNKGAHPVANTPS